MDTCVLAMGKTSPPVPKVAKLSDRAAVATASLLDVIRRATDPTKLKFDKRRKVFVINGTTVVRGLTKRIKARYGDEISLGSGISEGGRRAGGKDGRRYGSLVHSQMTRLIRNNGKGKSGPVARKMFSAIVNDLGLVPVYSELPVACERRRIGTAIDAVCVHPVDGQVWLVEWKTGYDDMAGYLGNSAQRMNIRIPFHRHALQLACTALMARETLRIKIPFERCVVVRGPRAEKAAATIHPIPTAVQRNAYRVFAEMAQDITAVARKKKGKGGKSGGWKRVTAATVL